MKDKIEWKSWRWEERCEVQLSSGHHLTTAFMKLKHAQTPPRHDSHNPCVFVF